MPRRKYINKMRGQEVEKVRVPYTDARGLNLLDHVVSFIDEHPERWNQGAWGHRDAVDVYDAQTGHYVTSRRSSVNECGTVGCIAGWTLILTKQAKWDKDGFIQFPSNGFHGTAGELLGLNYDETSILFNQDLNWDLNGKLIGRDKPLRERLQIIVDQLKARRSNPVLEAAYSEDSDREATNAGH